MKKQKGTTKNKAGAKCTYDPKIHPKLAEEYAYKGATDLEIARDIFGKGKTTLYEWIQKFPELANSIKKGRAKKEQEKKEKRLEIYEKKLRLLGRGYAYTEKEEIIDYRDIKSDKPGEAPKAQIVNRRVVKKTKRIHPNLTAIIFILINGDPEKWKNTKNMEIAGTLKTSIEMSEEEIDAELRNIDAKIQETRTNTPEAETPK